MVPFSFVFYFLFLNLGTHVMAFEDNQLVTFNEFRPSRKTQAVFQSLGGE